MHVMLLSNTGPISDQPLKALEMPRPQPGPGQVRIQVSVCGVCHTDLHTVEGDLPQVQLPMVPGHQVVGIVDRLGPGTIGSVKLGERVGVAWLNWACGKCDSCQGGLENLCSSARFTGLHAYGGYGEFLVVDEQFVFPLPAEFSDEQAAPLLCAGIIGFRSLRLSGIEPGGRLGLYGFGGSAHLVIQVARYWDCQVYVFSRNKAHQQHALELGAAWAGTAHDSPPSPIDAGITFAPAGWIVPLALGHLAPGGTLAINAIHMSAIPEMAYNQIYQERVLRSVANFTRKDAREFLALAARIPIECAVSLFPLDEANQVLAKLKRSEIRGAAVLRVGPSTD